MRFHLHALAVLLLITACDTGDSASSERATAPLEPTTRDSAGVAILEHSADALGRASTIRIDTVPIATIAGSADDEAADISTVVPVLFLADGRLVGLDRQQQEVVVFAADGSDRHRFGRQGAGPGEYGFLVSALQVADNTLLVHDARNARLSLLDLRDGSVTEWPLQEAIGLGASTPVAMVDGQVLLSGLNFSGGTDGPPPGVKGVVIDTATTKATRAFITGPEEQEDQAVRQVTGAGGAVIAVRAISIQPLQAFPGTFGWNGAFVSHDGNRLRFESRQPNGQLTQVLRIDKARLPVTDEVWEAYISDMIAQVSGQATSAGSAQVIFMGGGGGPQPDTADIRQRMRGEAHADSLPAIGRTMVTANGTLWVLDYPVPGQDGWAATAIAPDGRILGRIIEPAGDPPAAFGNDRLAFRTEDELGIATITVRRLRFP